MSRLPSLPSATETGPRLIAGEETVRAVQERIWGLGRGLFLLPSTLGPEAGLGVFTVAPIAKDALITYYGGVLIPHAQINALQPNHIAKSHARTLVSLRWIILANWRRSSTSAFGVEPIKAPELELPYRYGIAGYLNDVRDAGRTNVDFLSLSDSEYEPDKAKGVGVFLRALRDIPAGSELFVSYGEDYWNR